MFYVSPSSQAGSPSGSLAVSFDVGQDSLKLDLNHFTTCLMGKPSCTSLTLKKDTSHIIEGKECQVPLLLGVGPSSAPPPTCFSTSWTQEVTYRFASSQNPLAQDVCRDIWELCYDKEEPKNEGFQVQRAQLQILYLADTTFLNGQPLARC